MNVHSFVKRGELDPGFEGCPAHFRMNAVDLDQWAKSERYLVGVSAGRDSVALLHLLLERGYDSLIVCHLEHGLRGRAGRDDARFVTKLAQSQNLICEIGATDVRALAAREKLSIESAARAARYAFFAAVARRRRSRQIFLGHHADDLVETLLFNLFRGTGVAGLASLRETSIHQIGKTELKIIRPMLGVWRREIDDFIRSNEIKFREDATNKNLDPLRNRLRHRVIPCLEKIFGREIRRSVWRTAMIAAEENDWMHSLLPEFEEQLSVENLRLRPRAAQRRILQGWLRQHQVANVGFDLIERVRALLDLETGAAKTNLPGNRHARRRSGKIFLEEAARGSKLRPS